ncbi:ABC transporter ATP-binding protein [Microbacterium sp. JZ31]|uniref:ABC transporter ATP-binding protein n=1 Tax=Microbacterium sp. JZ31 TaxID=1906274 RepID=UPI0019319428|nr:ABC transporter ATP-binding protein [Microbacterium sp. JZ31]
MTQIVVLLRRLWPFLPHEARRFLVGYSLVSAVLSIVDVVALMLLAVVLASAVSGGSMTLPLIGAIPADALIWMILVLSAVVILKSAANLWLTWVATRRFASLEVEVGATLLAAYLRAPWTDRLARSNAEVVQLANGVGQVVSGFLLPVTTVPGMLMTSLGVVIVIFVAQPVTAVVALVYLGGIAALQYFVLGGKTRQAARVARDSQIRVARLVGGMVGALKEITLRDKVDESEAVVRKQRTLLARARANSNFLAGVPRFVFDSAVIGGFLLTGGAAYLAGGGVDAMVAAVALFGIAGFRLVPALTGFQSVITRTVSTGPLVDLMITDIEKSEEYRAAQEHLGDRPLPAAPRELTLSDVGFTFPDAQEPAVRDVTLTVRMGETLGIAGRSGAGKSTLIDLLLGLLSPTSGRITLDGEPLEEVLADWRSRVGYVPQEVSLFAGTIAQNIALVWDDSFDPERVERAARRAQLWDVIEQRSGGIHSDIADGGASLSGGQRQRLGIARALYTDPLVLVLDEATSALDVRTEAAVTSAIRELHGEVTVIAVAHRLSTIQGFDQIAHMRDGRIVSLGTFEQLVATDEDFAHQAALAGLARKDDDG